MLHIKIPDREFFDEKSERFVTIKGTSLQMEHSLVSVSKWEAKWHKPFLGNEPKTPEMIRDYYRCMTLTQNVNPDVFLAIGPTQAKEISDYVEDPMTASTVRNDGKASRQVITSELIYYWMTAFSIPFECQKWHLNRLLMLISICNAKNAPSKKMSRGEALRRNQSLNAERKRRLNTKG